MLLCLSCTVHSYYLNDRQRDPKTGKPPKLNYSLKETNVDGFLKMTLIFFFFDVTSYSIIQVKAVIKLSAAAT